MGRPRAPLSTADEDLIALAQEACIEIRTVVAFLRGAHPARRSTVKLLRQSAERLGLTHRLPTSMG
ncbi:MAG: hypothetical protein EPO40_17695 [Myxococcaceae bacterium]|nr:MAG: hypothetical protein EPO40_17695 [Myxococcaceae bacterium]